MGWKLIRGIVRLILEWLFFAVAFWFISEGNIIFWSISLLVITILFIWSNVCAIKPFYEYWVDEYVSYLNSMSSKEAFNVICKSINPPPPWIRPYFAEKFKEGRFGINITTTQT